jgi:ABC-2 type transport system ATP-binding protein
MIAVTPSPTGDEIVCVERLSRSFGDKQALDHVSLSVKRGTVHGLIGANGAGKTTLIKHLLGLLKAEQGKVRIFGHDPVADPVAVLSRVGYLSEDTDLPSWMTIRELMRYTASFFPAWDGAYADELCQTFELDPKAKIKNLSRGQKSRAGLLASLAYRPELLILDEPSSGLDPLVRRDILNAVIRTVADDGRTVIFSSHLLDELERVADSVALIQQGKLLYSGPLDELKANHRRLTLRFDQSRTQPPEFNGALTWQGRGQEWTTVCRGNSHDLRTAANGVGGQIVGEEAPTLDEIFVAHSQAKSLAQKGS